MKAVKTLLRRLGFLSFVVLQGLLLPTLAWAQAGAQAPGQEAAAEPPPYVFPYALVILCIGLALAVVLSSSKRRERAKPEVYGEPK